MKCCLHVSKKLEYQVPARVLCNRRREMVLICRFLTLFVSAPSYRDSLFQISSGPISCYNVMSCYLWLSLLMGRSSRVLGGGIKGGG